MLPVCAFYQLISHLYFTCLFLAEQIERAEFIDFANAGELSKRERERESESESLYGHLFQACLLCEQQLGQEFVIRHSRPRR